VTVPDPHRSHAMYKWTPGSHFYAFDEKFDGLESANDHLRMNGYGFSGLVEQHSTSTGRSESGRRYDLVYHPAYDGNHAAHHETEYLF
jgi:hypothetical protein